jgi:hypothetical protein
MSESKPLSDEHIRQIKAAFAESVALEEVWAELDRLRAENAELLRELKATRKYLDYLDLVRVDKLIAKVEGR